MKNTMRMMVSMKIKSGKAYDINKPRSEAEKKTDLIFQKISKDMQVMICDYLKYLEESYSE